MKMKYELVHVKKRGGTEKGWKDEEEKCTGRRWRERRREEDER